MFPYPQQGTSGNVWRHFSLSLCGGYVTDIHRIKVRDATKYPQYTASHNKGLFAQNVNCTSIDKPCIAIPLTSYIVCVVENIYILSSGIYFPFLSLVELTPHHVVRLETVFIASLAAKQYIKVLGQFLKKNMPSFLLFLNDGMWSWCRK